MRPRYLVCAARVSSHAIRIKGEDRSTSHGGRGRGTMHFFCSRACVRRLKAAYTHNGECVGASRYTSALHLSPGTPYSVSATPTNDGLVNYTVRPPTKKRP